MNITVNLLTNKNTYVLSDDLATEYSTNERGYKVIQGEDNATTITVNYPSSYAVFDKQVEMINAKGQQTILSLTGSEFTLPNTMTYAGNTTLVFSAIAEDIKVVWQKVIIPITSTGVDFTNIALANPDILGEAIEASKYYAQFKEDVEAGKFNGTDGIDGKDGLGGNLTILNNDEMELEVGKKYVVEVAGVAENGLVTARLVEEEEVDLSGVAEDRLQDFRDYEYARSNGIYDLINSNTKDGVDCFFSSKLTEIKGLEFSEKFLSFTNLNYAFGFSSTLTKVSCESELSATSMGNSFQGSQAIEFIKLNTKNVTNFFNFFEAVNTNASKITLILDFTNGDSFSQSFNVNTDLDLYILGNVNLQQLVVGNFNYSTTNINIYVSSQEVYDKFMNDEFWSNEIGQGSFNLEIKTYEEE